MIGPNGAGKTTLINQLGGQVTPDSGRIRFAGNDITALPIHRRSWLGLARSFQIASLFLDLSVLDNVALAVQAQAGHSFHFWHDARREPTCANQRGRRWRASASLTALTCRRPCSVMGSTACSNWPWRSPANRACFCLMSRWPASGRRNCPHDRVLRALKRDLTILLVEHDMEAVFALADRITVLVYGRAIASGTPEASAPMKRCVGPISARTMREPPPAPEQDRAS